jgi:RHS repeat-associated protein
MSWAYDTQGRVTGKGQTIGTVTKSVGYGYTNGDLISLVTPSGQTILYSYNSNHQVTGISVNGTVLLSNVTYEPFGQVNGWTWGNGTAVTRTYDTDGKIVSIASAGTKTYGYDDAFRITSINDTESGASDWTYGYDVLDRLTSAAGGSTTIGLTYDANGNRLTQSGTFTSTYNISSTSNQIVSITGTNGRNYSYDAAGNTLGYNGRTFFTYNDRGRMVANSNTTTGVSSPYVYNALGQLIETNLNTVGTRLFWYDESGHYLGVYNGSGGLGDETVWLGDIPVATIVASGHSFVFYYIHTDHLNTPRQATLPSNNTQMWTWFSDPFGTTAENQNPQDNGTFNYPPRFPGQLSTTQVAGLYQNGFRDYDPQTGSYIESDLIGLKAGTNTYAYAAGNPMSNFDPTGLDCVAVGGTVTCTAPGGGPTVSFPRPAGWPDYIGPSSENYHSYDELVNTANTNKKCLDDYIRSHPTPGSPSPASAGGTPNNASPSWVPSIFPSPVLSYVTSSNGNQVIVNVTQPGHPLFPGYVARTIQTGPYNSLINNYGEGAGALQGPYSPFATPINNVWQGLSDDAIKACSCHQ